MSEIITKTETTKRETFVISGKVLKLFKEWIINTKLSNQKIKILNSLNMVDYKCLEDVAKEVFPKKALLKSLPLLSYHINGSRTSNGLCGVEMIDKTSLKGGKVGISLTSFGNLMLKECVAYKNEY